MKYSNIPYYVVLLHVIELPFIEISIRLSSSLSPHEFIPAGSSGPLRYEAIWANNERYLNRT